MANTPKWVPAAPALVEAPESGAIDTTGNGTLTKIYSGKYADCVAGALNPGAAGSGDTAGLICRNSVVTKQPRGIGKLTIIWEGYSFGGGGTQLPAESYGLQSAAENLSVELNPGFDACAGDADLMNKVRTAGLRADSDSETAWNAIIALYTGSPSTPKYQQAVVLADLLRRSSTTYYEGGFTHYWTVYSLTLPTVSRGGFTETPGSPLGTLLATTLSLSCLRQADTLEVEQGFYKLTRIWLCISKPWDPVLYA